MPQLTNQNQLHSTQCRATDVEHNRPSRKGIVTQKSHFYSTVMAVALYVQGKTFRKKRTRTKIHYAIFSALQLYS